MAASSPLELPLLVIGSYTTETGGRAAGIRTLALSAAPDGAVVSREHVQHAPSPSFVVRHPDRPWLFAVSETSPGRVRSFALDHDGRLTRQGEADTGGEGPCHLALDPSARFLVAASYGSGSVSSFGVRLDGSLTDRLDLVTFAGSGHDPDRQEHAHAHQVVWDGAELLVCDLGTDQIHRLALDGAGSFVVAAAPVRLPAGSGPRHLARCGDHLVVVAELSAEVLLLRPTDDGWAVADTVPSAGTAEPPNAPSGIAVHGNRVFVANRGPDTVAEFEVDRAAGRLRPVTEFPCGGRNPRDITLAGGRLWVANQDSDLVSAFRTAALPGAAVELQFPSPSPTCVLVLDSVSS